jgi:predicted kinase
VLARGILWRLGVPFALRELACGLIRYHQVPYFLIDRPDARRLAIEISHVARCDRLALLAEADVRGRVCGDQQRLLDNVGLFAEYARELGCVNAPYPFASDHARVLYFRDPGRHPEAPAHEEFRTEVVLLSGLPGSGKDHHARTHYTDWQVIALDDIREDLDVSPADDQGAVLAEARERARQALRSGTPFVWNATNLSRQLRGQPLGLFAAYNARVRIAYLEVPESVLFAQNRQRSRVVPEGVMSRMIDRWEVPDCTEAHAVEWNVREG